MEPASQFSAIAAMAGAIAAMATSVLLSFWRKPLPFVPDDIRKAGPFQVARLATALVVVVLLFAKSVLITEHWALFALTAVAATIAGFLLTFWLCSAHVFAYRPTPKAAFKTVVGGKLTDEADRIRAKRSKSVVALLEESGDQPDLVFDRASVAGYRLLIMLGVLITMVGGGVAMGTLAQVAAAGLDRPGEQAKATR